MLAQRVMMKIKMMMMMMMTMMMMTKTMIKMDKIKNSKNLASKLSPLKHYNKRKNKLIYKISELVQKQETNNLSLFPML